MKTLLFTIFTLFAVSVFGQDKYNTIFFTENGEQFWVILNGVRQNIKPQTNVKVTGLNAPLYKLKVIFKDKELGIMEKTIFMPEESAEITFIVKQNRKGVYVAKYFGDTPLKTERTAPTQEVIVFMADNAYPADPWQSTTTTTTMMSTTTTVEDNNDQGGSIGISVGGVNVGVGISIDGDIDQETTETTVITSTTTTTTGLPANPRDPINNPRPVPGDVVVVNDGGCYYSMGDLDFQRAKESVDSKTFADSKLTMAKQIADSNCLSSKQVASLVNLFDFEDGKLTFAKYAYNRTVDKNNYFIVNDAFTYSSSIDELNEYIRK